MNEDILLPIFLSIAAVLVLLLIYFTIAQVVDVFRKVALYKKRTFAWYRTNYPDQIRGSKVSCYECGGERIHVRELMNQTFTREHFCTACGKTLYYSPEG
jgi:hypothetical protein